MDSKNSTHRSRQASQASGQQVPPSVQAVLEFGYPKDVVLSTYQQLSTGSLNPSAQPGHEDPQGAAGGARIPTVTAALLMTSLDAILAQPRASGGDGSGLQCQEPGFFSEMVISGNRADSDVSEDGPGDQPGTSSSSATQSAAPGDNPGHSHPAARDRNTAETAQGTTTSHPPTAQSLSFGSAAANTNVTAGDETPTVTSTTSNATRARNEAVSASPRSSDPPVPPAAPTPASGSTPPHQSSQPRILTGASSAHSAPAAVGVAESQSSPAEDRARERKRLLTRLRALREENRRLKARQMCRQCRQKPVDLTFLPCGHFIYCQSCGSSFEACPACTKTILADVKTFLS